MARESLACLECLLSKDMSKEREPARWFFGGRTFQAEEITSAKALGQENVWHQNAGM
jgi:hypothetical protein